MTRIQKSALVAYSAEQMYALVADIEAYGEFLPWCGGAQIKSRTPDSVTAAIAIAYRGVNKSFTTCNTLQPGRSMELTLVDGPFRHLRGFWRFDPLDATACKVSLDLEFEFSNRLLALVAGPVFESIANSLVDSFHARAVAVYGRQS